MSRVLNRLPEREIGSQELKLVIAGCVEDKRLSEKHFKQTSKSVKHFCLYLARANCLIFVTVKAPRSAGMLSLLLISEKSHLDPNLWTSKCSFVKFLPKTQSFLAQTSSLTTSRKLNDINKSTEYGTHERSKIVGQRNRILAREEKVDMGSNEIDQEHEEQARRKIG